MFGDIPATGFFIRNFRSFGSRWLKDRTIDGLTSESF